jgi:ubiquinone/menaquinone biosynthesis C-methylase UbiE
MRHRPGHDDAAVMTSNALAGGPATLPALLRSLRGTVVELGPGHGGSLHHYDRTVRWIGVEPRAGSREQVWREAVRLGRQVQVLAGRAERLDLPDGGVDAVVTSLVLCSVARPARALSEMHRVLRPGGRYVFVEHVAAPRGTWLRRGQHAWTWTTAAFGAQCRANRDTEPAIESAGFQVTGIHRFVLPGPFGTAIPHIIGTAVRVPDLVD